MVELRSLPPHDGLQLQNVDQIKLLIYLFNRLVNNPLFPEPIGAATGQSPFNVGKNVEICIIYDIRLQPGLDKIELVEFLHDREEHEHDCNRDEDKPTPGQHIAQYLSNVSPDYRIARAYVVLGVGNIVFLKIQSHLARCKPELVFGIK